MPVLDHNVGHEQLQRRRDRHRTHAIPRLSGVASSSPWCLCAVLALALLARRCSASTLISDVEALQSLKLSVANVEALSTWGGPDACGSGSSAPWTGVECATSMRDPMVMAITSLRIPDLGLGGSLPPSLGRLQELSFLDMSGNNLTGTIPPALWRLPLLRSLWLSRNELLLSQSSVPKVRLLDLRLDGNPTCEPSIPGCVPSAYSTGPPAASQPPPAPAPPATTTSASTGPAPWTLVAVAAAAVLGAFLLGGAAVYLAMCLWQRHRQRKERQEEQAGKEEFDSDIESGQHSSVKGSNGPAPGSSKAGFEGNKTSQQEESESIVGMSDDETGNARSYGHQEPEMAALACMQIMSKKVAPAKGYLLHQSEEQMHSKGSNRSGVACCMKPTAVEDDLLSERAGLVEDAAAVDAATMAAAEAAAAAAAASVGKKSGRLEECEESKFESRQGEEAPVALTGDAVVQHGHEGEGDGNEEMQDEGDVRPAEGTVTVFTRQQLKEATQSFSPDVVIGSGGFGTVYRGDIGGRAVAVKVLDEEGTQGEREFESEVAMLSELRSPQLVSLVGYCRDARHGRMMLVYEFMANGSLEDVLHHKDRFEAHYKRPAPFLDWRARMQIALDAAMGLVYLHEVSASPGGIIHRDLKSSNVLLDDNLRAHIADFGLARSGPTGEKRWVSTRILGTTGYLAPEYIMTGRLTMKSDVYAFGVLMLELLTGCAPIDRRRGAGRTSLTSWALPLVANRDRVMELVDPALEGRVSPHEFAQAAAVASVCIQSNPEYRPHMENVVTSLMPLVRHRPAAPASTYISTSASVSSGSSSVYQL